MVVVGGGWEGVGGCSAVPGGAEQIRRTRKSEQYEALRQPSAE